MTWDGTRLRFREQSPISVMLKQNRLDPTLGFFWGIVLLHIILWTLLASKTQPNVPYKTLELLTAGREIAWGYPNQPPLSVWVASVVGKIAAPRVWPLYLFAQLCGIVSVWAAWILARKFLHPWTALCGAIVLLGGYSCTIAASEFSSAHLASAFWSLSILSFHEALTESRRRYWAATGILLGLGFLTSYGTLLLLITMFMFTIWNDHARRCWDSSWPFLAGLMMMAVMMPHLFWLVQNDFSTIQTRLAPASSFAHHLEQPLAYLGTQLLCLIPVVLLLTPLVAWFSFEEPSTPQSEERSFARHYLLWMSCIPPMVIFTLALLAGPSSTLFAGVANWTFLGIALLLWGHLNETRMSWRRSLLRIGSAVGFFAAALIAMNLMLPHLSRQAFNTHFPGRELARGVEQAWRQSGYSGPVPVIAGPRNLVRNAVWNSGPSSKVTMYDNLTPTTSQGHQDMKLMEQGGVIIWEQNAENAAIGQQFVQRYGRVSLAQPQTFRWKGIADLPELNIGMAVVHPALAQVTPRPTFPVANQVPNSSLPSNYPQSNLVPAYSNSSTVPNNGYQNNGSTNGLSTQPASVPATYQYPVSNSNSSPLVTPASSYQLPMTTPLTPTSTSSGSSALKGFDFPSSSVSSGQQSSGQSQYSQPATYSPTTTAPQQPTLPSSNSGYANDPFAGMSSGGAPSTSGAASLPSSYPPSSSGSSARNEFNFPSTGNSVGQPSSMTTGTPAGSYSQPSLQSQSLPVAAPKTAPMSDDPFSSLAPKQNSTYQNNSSTYQNGSGSASPGSNNRQMDEVLPDLDDPNVKSPGNSTWSSGGFGSPSSSTPTKSTGTTSPSLPTLNSGRSSFSGFEAPITPARKDSSSSSFPGEVMPEQFGVSPNLNSNGAGASPTGGTKQNSIPPYQFSKEFLEKYPELAPASSSNSTNGTNFPAAAKGSAGQYDSPIADPFLGGSGPAGAGFKEPASSPVPVRNDYSSSLRDALPASSGSPSGLIAPGSSSNPQPLLPMTLPEPTPAQASPSKAPAGLTEQ